MIPIGYRLDDMAENEYIEAVLKCMDTPVDYALKIEQLLDKIACEEPQIKRNIMGQAKKFSTNPSNLSILYAWLVMSYKDIEEIKKFFEKKIKVALKAKNKYAEKRGIEIKEIKSYNGLRIRRKRAKYKKNPLIKNMVDKRFGYDNVYDDFSTFNSFYESFSKRKINSWIVEKADMKVCPYCNIAYTYNRGKSVTAQLDHFFPKSEYPMFALCFYNLIPSCSACNRIKHDDLQEFASPYKEGVFQDLKITWEYEGKADDERYTEKDSLEELEKKIEIKIVTPELPEQNNISAMKIFEAYQQHKDYAGEVIKKIKTYANPDAQKLISDIWEPEGITPEEITRFYFDNYLDKTDLKKRPLSKLTRDFFEEYKKYCKPI